MSGFIGRWLRAVVEAEQRCGCGGWSVFPGLVGETIGESHSVDGGAYGCRALVGGVDGAMFTYLLGTL
jgi:hypothetical protein